MESLVRGLAARPATRRFVLAAAAGAAIAPSGLPAQEAATPDPGQARLEAFIALSQAVVGGGRIDPKRAAQFLALNDATDDDKALLDAMLAEAPDAVAANPARHPLVNPILTYWYIGEYKGQAVEGRDAFWYGLSSWQAVKYTSATGICKRFGDWADAPNVT